MKAEQTSQPMEEEQLDPQNQSNGNSEPKHDPNDSVCFRQGAVTHSMCNGNNRINPTDHASLISSLPLNPNLNGMSSCSKRIDPVLNEMNEEPQKSERSGMSLDTIGLLKSRDSLSETNPSQPNEASPPHVPDRVSQKNVQGRILPSWTRRSRPPTVIEIPPTQFTTERKGLFNLRSQVIFQKCHRRGFRLLRKMMKVYLYWRRLIINLARSNELLSMELSWAWEPAYR